MYPTAKNFEEYGTWHQMVVMVYGKRDIRSAISILKALVRPVNPAHGLLLVSWLLALFGPLPPEVVEAATFLCLSGIEGVADSSSFEEVMCPNHGDLELMVVSLMEAILNGLVTMPGVVLGPIGCHRMNALMSGPPSYRRWSAIIILL